MKKILCITFLSILLVFISCKKEEPEEVKIEAEHVTVQHILIAFKSDLIPNVTRTQAEAEKPPPTGHERILFIDDELPLVEIGRQLLQRLGYDVVTRTSSIEALELFRVKPHGFDLVITDMTMPNMTGDNLAAELMSIRPDTPVVLCTGYSERISEERAKGIGIRAFLMKPIVKRRMAETVRRVLDNATDVC